MAWIPCEYPDCPRGPRLGPIRYFNYPWIDNLPDGSRGYLSGGYLHTTCFKRWHQEVNNPASTDAAMGTPPASPQSSTETATGLATRHSVELGSGGEEA